MSVAKIPIRNLYYLLCYAWDKLDEGEKVFTGASDYEDLLSLFGRVLINGCHLLFKRGVERNYLETAAEYSGIKGKIEFAASLRKNLFRRGRAVCVFDEFSSDILSNQILKAMLLTLTKLPSVDEGVKQEAWLCYCRFSGVRDVFIQSSDFARVRIHRNNTFYDFLLKVSELIYENIVLDERTGAYRFTNFVGNDKRMAKLFEAFVRNFLKKEQNRFQVRVEDIPWDAVPLGSSTSALLPKMQTDITLESPDRKIIIDTKYYTEALSSRFETEKFRSDNLYQLYSYLRNIEAKKAHPMNALCEGMLLYPTVNQSLNEQYQLGAHIMRVRTINLNQEWRLLKSELLRVCLA